MVSEISHTKINSIYLCLYMDSKEQKCRYNETETDSWYRGQTSVVQWHSNVWLFVTPWTAARQASLPFTIFRSLPKFLFLVSVMPSSHLILWRPLLLPSVFPSIRDFFNGLSVLIRWPNYWSFSNSLSSAVLPVNNRGWFPLKLTSLISLLSKGLSRVFSSTTVRKHQFFGAQLSLCMWYHTLGNIVE